MAARERGVLVHAALLPQPVLRRPHVRRKADHVDVLVAGIEVLRDAALAGVRRPQDRRVGQHRLDRVVSPDKPGLELVGGEFCLLPPARKVELVSERDPRGGVSGVTGHRRERCPIGCGGVPQVGSDFEVCAVRYAVEHPRAGQGRCHTAATVGEHLVQVGLSADDLLELRGAFLVVSEHTEHERQPRSAARRRSGRAGRSGRLGRYGRSRER